MRMREREGGEEEKGREGEEDGGENRNTCNVEEVERKRATTVPETKPVAETPESTPNADARLRSPTLSACAREGEYIMGVHFQIRVTNQIGPRRV